MKTEHLFGLIGYPLGHSFSRIFFNQKFNEENLTNCSFELFPIEHIRLFSSLISQHPEIKGLAVTIPHKEKVMPLLDEIDVAAAAIGAVNCITFTKGTSKGYNTDAVGFEKSLIPFLGGKKLKALVLGNGGASKAVQYVLKKNDINYLTVGRKKSSKSSDVHYDELDENTMKEHLLIINCTPSGMSPNEQDCPDIPYQYAGANHFFYDLIYKPIETLFLKKGREAGAAIKNGLEMFELQAEANWQHWKKAMD